MMNHANERRHHVVVVGAGFGGLYAVNELVDSNVDVTLIDRRNFHLFQPLLYQVATGTISATDVSAPIRSIFGKKENITVRLDSATGIDVRSRHINTKSHTRIKYDDLIIATGVSHHYFGHHEWQKNAPGLNFAKKFLIPFKTIDTKKSIYETAILNEIKKKKISLICLAGYMKILS